MPNELELIALETEFELYLSFTKRLVLNLPDSEDRSRAAIWLQKLRSITTDDQKKLRNEHLKLLLFALHRRSMLSVFEKPPPEELESFHDGCTLMEMTRELIEMTEKKLASGDSGTECPLPPVSTNISSDLKEYSSSQLIPKFGAQVYYAISSEPIQMWSKSPNCVYPDASDVPSPLQWELTLSRLTDHVLEKQNEAERQAAEAASDDKTEKDTHVLPKVVVPLVDELPFKWKADSILALHQNYDFSDCGVAEDLELQGKFQLELDEMAFGILDHSLPGRQRVVVRDPYFNDLPPDIAERRHHGVVDEAESETASSSSSSEMESMNGVKESVLNDRTSNSTQVKTGGRKCNGSIKSPQNQQSISTMSAKQSGPLAQKYLSPENDFEYGIHFDEETGGYKLGQRPVTFDGDDILINFDGEVIKFKGSEGLWRLLTQDMNYFDEEFYFTEEDWVVYMEILSRTNQPEIGPTCTHLKEIDELLRIFINLQKPNLSSSMYCGFTQNSLLFWITERIAATIGKEGGLEQLIDWIKVNKKLILKSNLLCQLTNNLPWGYHYSYNPICNPVNRETIGTACKSQYQRYEYFSKADEKLQTDVKVGIEFLKELSATDPAFFDQLDVSDEISSTDLEMALQRGLEFLQSYFG